MIYGYFVSVIYFITITKCSNGIQLPAICSQCICRPNNDSFVTVDCRSDVKSYIFDAVHENKDEIDARNSITNLTIRFNEIITLNKVFLFDKLESLDLARNDIVFIDGSVFRKLQNMKTLILSYNNLKHITENAFQGQYEAGDLLPLRSLKTLMLDHNELHSLNSDVFEHTERIEFLSLAYNPFTVLDTSTVIAITNLAYLQNLDLSYTEISSLPEYFLHTPKYLSTLNLSGNKFQQVPQALKEAHSLKTLHLSDNSFVNLTKDNGFPEIPTLRTLHLCESPELINIGPGSLSNLTKLEELYIAGNSKLTRIDDGALATSDKHGTLIVWPNIKKMYINDNQLAYINKSILSRWDTLAELDLLNNPWTCECENQWMVETLMPVYLRIDDEKAKSLKCAAPKEMAAYRFYELYETSYNMRCLDLYGAEPEKDAALLVGMLAGVLLGIPIVLLLIYSYKRHWFGIFDDSPAAFSRQFYNKTNEVYEY